MLPLQGARVQSLVSELKIPHAMWHSQKKMWFYFLLQCPIAPHYYAAVNELHGLRHMTVFRDLELCSWLEEKREMSTCEWRSEESEVVQLSFWSAACSPRSPPLSAPRPLACGVTATPGISWPSSLLQVFSPYLPQPAMPAPAGLTFLKI